MKVFFVVALVLLAGFASAEGDFDVRWEYYTTNGIHDVYVFDLDDSGSPEIYACTYGVRPSIWVLRGDGELSYKILVPRPGLTEFGNEDITFMYPTDLDDDRLLDIVSATEIISSGVNSHRVYRLEREFEEDLNRYSTNMDWLYERIGFVTGVVLHDTTSDGIDDVYVSSDDFKVRLLDSDGKHLVNVSLDGSIWDLTSYPKSDGSIFLLAAAFHEIVMLNPELQVQWNYTSDVRFTEAYMDDVDNDSMVDIFVLGDEELYRFNEDGSVLWRVNVGDISTNIDSADLDGDGFDEILIGGGQKIYAYNTDGSLSWELPVKYKPNRVYARDIDGDGELTLLVSMGKGLTAYYPTVLLNETAGYIREANNNLVFAWEYYNRGNYSLAISYASDAKDLFIVLGDMESGVAADELIAKSNWAQSADEYYIKALDSFESEEYIEARDFTELAIEYYSKVNSTSRLHEVLSFNNSLYYTLYGAANKSLGDWFYSEAESYYINNNLPLTLEYARNATYYYEIAGYGDGLKKAEYLINSAGGGTTIVDASTTSSVTSESSTLPSTTTLIVVGEDTGLKFDDYLLIGSVLLLLVIGFFVFKYLRR